MRERLAELEDQLCDALTKWGIRAAAISHIPLGFGDHHWSVTDMSGRRWFTTVADLGHKSFLGSDPATVRARLHAAMDTAAHLHDERGLGFVVAPLRTSGDATVVPVGERHALSVFPFVAGTSGGFGQELAADQRLRVLDLLAQLHQRIPPRLTPPAPFEVVGLSRVAEVLKAADGGCKAVDGGPFSGPARELLTRHARDLRRRLNEFDRRSAGLGGSRAVVTHGEPHPGNLLWLGGRPMLIDWDTVGTALPERDLWLVTDDPDELQHYTRISGHRVDPEALDLYRLRWDLKDLVELTDWLLAPHEGTRDTAQAWEELRGVVDRLVS